MQVKFKKLRPNAVMPTRVTSGSAAYDAILGHEVSIKQGRQIIPLGFAISMPNSIYLDCRTRAGYAAKGMIALDREGNEHRIDADVILGLIDSDYRNEVGVIINVHQEIAEPLFFYAGQAIAQLNFGYVPPTEFVEVDELDETSRTGGFGKMNNE